MFLASVKKLEESSVIATYKYSKGTNTLKFTFMHSKDKIPLDLKQNIVYKWSYPDESYSHSYIGDSNKCLENRVKEHSRNVPNAIYIYSEPNNHSHASMSHFKVIDQDSKQVVREARVAIHIRISNLALSCNTGKMYILEIFNCLLGAGRPSDGSDQMAGSDFHKVINISPFQVTGFPEQCARQIQ